MVVLQYWLVLNFVLFLLVWGLEFVEDGFVVDFEFVVCCLVLVVGGVELIFIDLVIGSQDVECVVSIDYLIMQGFGDLCLLFVGVLWMMVEVFVDIMWIVMVQMMDLGGVLMICLGFGGDGLSYMDFNILFKFCDVYVLVFELVVILYFFIG